MRYFILLFLVVNRGCVWQEGCKDGNPRDGSWVCPTEEMHTNENILLDAYEAQYGEINAWTTFCFESYVYREVSTAQEVTSWCGMGDAEGCTLWNFTKKDRIMVQYHDDNHVWTHNDQRHELLHLLLHCKGVDGSENVEHSGPEWSLISQLSKAESAGNLDTYFYQ